jgi:outer membrane receptor protein involved in Fe transport
MKSTEEKRLAALKAWWLATAVCITGVPIVPVSADEGQQTASSDLETITVTARKREERLIDVPVSANVLSADDIGKYAISDPADLNNIAPGLNIVREGGGAGPGAAVSIRGISVFGQDNGLEQPVAIVIDGIPISRGFIMDAGLFDLANIQVLKGPQALFFGKDSPAGVVAMDSVSPKPGAPLQGYAKASYGFVEEDPILEGAVSIPVTDTFAIRIALRAEDMQGGYLRNDSRPLSANISRYPVPGANFKEYPQTKEVLGRFTAVWKPTDSFDTTFKFLRSYFHQDAAFAAASLIHCANGVHPYYHNLLTGVYTEDTAENCANGRTTYDPTIPAAVLAGFPGASSDGKYFTRVQQSIGSLAVNYRLPAVTISSNTGLYRLNAGEFDNADMDSFAETPSAQVESTQVWTEELRATTTFALPVNFTGGGFYEHEQRTWWQDARIFTLGPYPVPGPFQGFTADYINYDVNGSDTYSIFGQVNWKILDNLELTGGGRWTDAHRRSDIGQPFQYIDLFYVGLPGGPAVNDPNFTPTGNVYHVQTSYQNFSPEATLAWHPTSNLMVYGAYKTGFLAGGVQNTGNVPNLTQLPQSEITSSLTYAPEKNRGGELGVKGSFFDSRLSGDLTLYRYKYYGLQIATYHANTTSFTIGNAASALNEGVDANATFHVDDQLSVHGSVGYVLNRYINYPNAPCYAGQMCPSGTQNLSGQRFSSAPLTVMLGANYETPLTGQYKLALTADVAGFSRSPLINEQPDTETRAYHLLNASLRVFPSSRAWEVSLIGTNLTNAIYFSNIYGKPLGQNQDIWGVPNPGREIRLQVARNF